MDLHLYCCSSSFGVWRKTNQAINGRSLESVVQSAPDAFIWRSESNRIQAKPDWCDGKGGTLSIAIASADSAELVRQPELEVIPLTHTSFMTQSNRVLMLR